LSYSAQQKLNARYISSYHKPRTWYMLWSQIKLTSYDFTDLHITGDFDNRPGTGRFLRVFSCVVTYCKGAGRRLYMKTSADARSGTVRRCKRSARHRTVPGRFYANFQVQWWIHLYQNLPLFLQRNRLLNLKRLRLTLTVMVIKTTHVQNFENFNSTCSLHVNHPWAKYIFFVIMFLVFRSEISM